MIATSHWKLDHIAHVVPDLESALESYQRTLAIAPEHRETLESEAVELAFLPLGNSLLELISPLEKNQSLTRFLDKRGSSLHHIAYRVPSVETELERLAQAGVSLIDKAPRPGSRGKLIAFIDPKSVDGVLIELCSPASD